LSINVIPFNTQITKLRKSITRWRDVHLWYPPELEALDEIGSKICESNRLSRNVYRKLAAFWCPHDTFVYLDTDIVVGSSPTHWLARYKQVQAKVDVVVIDDDLQWVFRSGRLSEEFSYTKRAAANSGFWIGRRGLISFKDVISAADSAQGHKDEFFAEYGEQSFWNYLLWRKKLVARTFPVLGSEFADRAWAPQNVVLVDGLGFAKRNSQTSSNSNSNLIIPFLHWAGLTAGPEMANWHLFLESALSAANWLGKLALLNRFCRLNPRAFLLKIPKYFLRKALRRRLGAVDPLPAHCAANTDG
jgi:hypothetical protein